MMKNKLFNCKLTIVSLLICLCGCADFLDKEPPAAISEDTFWQNENDALLALTGCYRGQTGWSRSDFTNPFGLLFFDLAGGNGTEKEQITTLLASANTTSTHYLIGEFWRNSYTQITKFNIFLENIESCPMDESKKEQWKAEVRFLRAYYFFNLAFYFKDIPMPLKSLNVEEANTIGQESQASVYKYIETELLEIVDLLPIQRSDAEYGRINRAASQILLGRLYLAQQKWTNAANMFLNVINQDVYELDRRNGKDSYEKLFQIGGEYSPETIYCVMGMKDKYNTAFYQFLYPEIAYGGWHQFAPYNELVKEYFCADGKSIEESESYNDNDPYINRDLRLYASIFLPPVGSFEGSKYNDLTYDCFGASDSPDRYNKYPLFNGYAIKKFCDPTITGNLGGSYVYTPIMRYAEVLLSYLEALNESNPENVSQEILDLTINDVRNRVNLSKLTKAELSTQEKIREAVRKERRVEMAFEGLRYFDVLRWGIAEEVLNHHFTGVKLSDNPNDRNYKGSGDSASPVDKDNYYLFEQRRWLPFNRYLPIPQSELNINKNLKQNEGYN